ERQCPMLELKFVELSKSLRAFEIGWLTFFFELDLLAERIFQSTLDQIDCEISDVDSDPLPIELLCGVNRCAAPAKRIKHDIAGIARSADDALEKRLWFLRRVTQSFLCL